MPRRITMSDLRTRCIRRCDKENDASIALDEWNALISESFGELWGIVAESGLRYWETSTTIIANGSESYTEPDDILATIGIDHLEAGTVTGTRRSLDEIMVQERSRWTGNTGEARAYALADDQLYLYPRPASGTYLWLYIPQASDLSQFADADVVDVVTPDGERFVIWCTAVKALAKSESDVQLAMTERDIAREALREWAVLRAFNAPRRRIIRDGDGHDEYWGPHDAANWWNR
jgi:hypothetical protein